jgi:hypothetical protein
MKGLLNGVVVLVVMPASDGCAASTTNAAIATDNVAILMSEVSFIGYAFLGYI